MGLLQWRWLILGVVAAVLCAPLSSQITRPNLRLAVVYAKDAVKPGRDAPRVEETKVEAEGELALIDLGAGITDDPGAEDLEGGVTATGNAQARDKAKNTATGQHPVAVLPFDDTRFLLNERQADMSLSAKAQHADRTPKAKPAPAKAAPGVNKKPAPATSAKTPAKSTAKSAVKKPAAGKFIESLGLEDPAAAPVTPARQDSLPMGPEVPAGRSATESAADGPTLEQYFSTDELADSGSASTELQPGGAITTQSATDTASDLYAGVIPTQGGSSVTGPATAPLSAAMRDGKNNGIGSNLVAVSPWRAVTMVLLTLAFLFVGAVGRRQVQRHPAWRGQAQPGGDREYHHRAGAADHNC